MSRRRQYQLYTTRDILLHKRAVTTRIHVEDMPRYRRHMTTYASTHDNAMLLRRRRNGHEPCASYERRRPTMAKCCGASVFTLWQALNENESALDVSCYGRLCERYTMNMKRVMLSAPCATLRRAMFYMSIVQIIRGKMLRSHTACCQASYRQRQEIAASRPVMVRVVGAMVRMVVSTTSRTSARNNMKCCWQAMARRTRVSGVKRMRVATNEIMKREAKNKKAIMMMMVNKCSRGRV